MDAAQQDAPSEVGRALARLRWGDSALRSAIKTLQDRRDELGEAHRSALREIAGPEDKTDD